MGMNDMNRKSKRKDNLIFFMDMGTPASGSFVGLGKKRQTDYIPLYQLKYK
jgi:hypothetical protein